MSTHTSKSKWRFLWLLPVIALGASSISKILQLDFIVQSLNKAGVDVTVPILGVIELLCVIIFLVPKTRNIGFLLMTAFIGGIIVTEWNSPAQAPIVGILLQVFLWMGMYFEHASFFKLNPASSN